MSAPARLGLRRRTRAQASTRPVRFIVSAPRGSDVAEPDFARMGLTLVHRSPGSWLVQGPASAQAVRDALAAEGLSDWSVHPEQFYRRA